MAAYQHLYLLQYSLLALALALTALQITVAVEFTVNNTAGNSPGGLRFEKDIGVKYTKQLMSNTTNFIWNMLEETNANDRKKVEEVSIVIDVYKGAEAICYGNTINVSAVYLEGYQGDVKWEFTSLIHHEMTHVWQWNGAGQAPIGLVEGIADYTILKANYYPPGFAKPGMGERWDQGYDFTARFLEYCDGLRPGFVAALNKKMKDSFSVDFFVELLGKPVDELWREYKEKFGGGVAEAAEKLSLNMGRRRAAEKLSLNLGRSREYRDRYLSPFSA
ncbi:hypothetical protein U1Q18_041881 [Sarracenia purpurea var. burkii]